MSIESERLPIDPPFILKNGAPCDAYLTVDTAVLRLSPAFLELLRSRAPKRRRGKAGYVFLAALVAILLIAGGGRSIREFWKSRPRISQSIAHDDRTVPFFSR